MRDIRPAAVLSAEALHAISVEVIRKHRRMCGQCNSALRIGQPHRTCETGWLLVKDERLEAAKLRAAESDAQEHAAAQLALW